MFSGLSASFIGTVCRSTSSLNVQDTARSISRLSDVPSYLQRTSSITSDQPNFRMSSPNDFGRSPTPGSTIGLLAGTSRPLSQPRSLHRRAGPITFGSESHYSMHSDRNDHDIVSFGFVSRPSTRSFVGSPNREFFESPRSENASVNEAWSQSSRLGTGTTAELTSKEMRGALVRLGGHLLGAILSFVSHI